MFTFKSTPPSPGTDDVERPDPVSDAHLKPSGWRPLRPRISTDDMNTGHSTNSTDGTRSSTSRNSARTRYALAPRRSRVDIASDSTMIPTPLPTTHSVRFGIECTNSYGQACTGVVQSCSKIRDVLDIQQARELKDAGNYPLKMDKCDGTTAMPLIGSSGETDWSTVRSLQGFIDISSARRNVQSGLHIVEIDLLQSYDSNNVGVCVISPDESDTNGVVMVEFVSALNLLLYTHGSQR